MLNNFALIREVEARRPLWDKTDWDCDIRDCDVVDSGKREELWEEIASKLKTPVCKVRARWKNLRDSYRRLIFKSNSTHYPRWRYFNSMSFLRDVIVNTKLRNIDDYLAPSPCVTIKMEETQSNNKENGFDESPPTEEDMGGTFSAENQHESSFLESFITSDRKRKKSDDVEYIEMQGSVEEENHLKMMRLLSNDEDLQFLLSLHSHLKKVPVHKKLLIRIKLEKIFYDELYGEKVNTQNTNYDNSSECN